MLTKLFTVLTVVAFAVGAQAATAGRAASSKRDVNIPDVDYYDCRGKNDTLEVHPWDCTRFIQCDNGRAHDKSCAECHVDADECPTGWLQYDPKNEWCTFANVAGCHTSGNVTASTENPITTTISPADPRCPENCEYRPVGCECSIFYQCRNGTYTEYICPAGLHFNVKTLQCDVAEKAGCNLNPTDCCECLYIPKGDCSSQYIFQDHDRNATSYEGDHHCIREERVCDNELVWNSKANGADGACDFKANVPACTS